jgi:D-amino-acid dehydrogenase
VADTFHPRGTPDKVRHQARAQRTLLDQNIETLAPVVQNAGAQDLVQRLGHLFVYRSLTSWQKERTAWNLRADNGITWDEFDVDKLRQLDPNLSREYADRSGGRCSSRSWVGRTRRRAR